MRRVISYTINCSFLFAFSLNYITVDVVRDKGKLIKLYRMHISTNLTKDDRFK